MSVARACVGIGPFVAGHVSRAASTSTARVSCCLCFLCCVSRPLLVPNANCKLWLLNGPNQIEEHAKQAAPLVAKSTRRHAAYKRAPIIISIPVGSVLRMLFCVAEGKLCDRMRPTRHVIRRLAPLSADTTAQSSCVPIVSRAANAFVNTLQVRFRVGLYPTDWANSRIRMRGTSGLASGSY